MKKASYNKQGGAEIKNIGKPITIQNPWRSEALANRVKLLSWQKPIMVKREITVRINNPAVQHIDRKVEIKDLQKIGNMISWSILRGRPRIQTPLTTIWKSIVANRSVRSSELTQGLKRMTMINMTTTASCQPGSDRVICLNKIVSTSHSLVIRDVR